MQLRDKDLSMQEQIRLRCVMAGAGVASDVGGIGWRGKTNALCCRGSCTLQLRDKDLPMQEQIRLRCVVAGADGANDAGAMRAWWRWVRACVMGGG